MTTTLHIDGSQGEGGGQILRSSVALAAICGRPLRIDKIRAGRRRPGLKRQHLTAIRAVAEICGGRLEGDELNGSELSFEPGELRHGDYEFSVAGAGSALLVLQSVLWPLAMTAGESCLRFEGGTHNPMAPCFDFVEKVFAPLARKLGVELELSLERHGFMPAGGGRFTATIKSRGALEPFELLERGELRARRATAMVANLPGTIAIRELRRIRELLGWKNEECLPNVISDSRGPGNVLTLLLEHEGVSEMVTVFGEMEITAEEVAAKGAEAVEQYLAHGAPVGAHLADQLILPLALAGRGAFATGPLTEHTRTNIEVVKRFLPVPIQVDEEGGRTTIRIG